MEWRLFDTEPPEPPAMLARRDWMELEHQPGFRQRAHMVAQVVTLITALRPGITTITDLGCGDGSVMARFPANLTAWGYELGPGDVRVARERGLDVRQADILTGDLEYGDVLAASEVLEHLADPQPFLQLLPDRVLVVSSPSLETGDWHNPIHAWAWDMPGYRDLLERSGWRVVYQAECDGGWNQFGGVEGPQRFQVAVGLR